MLLKQCLTILLENNNAIQFEARQDWIGVYRFLKDMRIKQLTQDEFKNLADSITPDNMPVNKRISTSTMSNSSKLGLPDTPYYKWTNRQLDRNKHIKHLYELCTALWDILCLLIYEKS